MTKYLESFTSKLAKCKNMPPSFFFPKPEKKGGRPRKEEELEGDEVTLLDKMERENARFCNGAEVPNGTPCPVKTECLEFALRTNVKHGVWGGLSSKQRDSIRRQRNLANRALNASKDR